MKQDAFEVSGTSPDRLVGDVTKALALHQPAMTVWTQDGLLVAEGELIVASPDCPDERFAVRIEVPRDFPESEPKVFETGGRIPRTSDRHMFEDNGACCTGVYEEWLVEAGDPTFSAFLCGPVDRFFFSQVWFELTERVHGTGGWPFGERSHGLLGILEGYAAAIGIVFDPEKAGPLFAHLRLLERKNIKGHVRCPCGSGKRLRDCHSDRLRRLRVKVSPRLARRMLARIALELRSIQTERC